MPPLGVVDVFGPEDRLRPAMKLMVCVAAIPVHMRGGAETLMFQGRRATKRPQ